MVPDRQLATDRPTYTIRQVPDRPAAQQLTVYTAGTTIANSLQTDQSVTVPVHTGSNNTYSDSSWQEIDRINPTNSWQSTQSYSGWQAEDTKRTTGSYRPKGQQIIIIINIIVRVLPPWTILRRFNSDFYKYMFTFFITHLYLVPISIVLTIIN